MGLEKEGLKPEPGMGQASPLLSGHHDPIGGRGGTQVAGAEALRFGSKLALLPLCGLSPFPTVVPLPQRGAVLEQEGFVGVLGM